MTLTIGQIFQSRYRILRPLGQGGMGAVYLAEDMRLGSRCVVKESVPDPDRQSPDVGPVACPVRARSADPGRPEPPQPAEGHGLLHRGRQRVPGDGVCGGGRPGERAGRGMAARCRRSRC